MGTRNEASKVRSMTGALAFTMGLALDVGRETGVVSLEALEPSAL